MTGLLLRVQLLLLRHRLWVLLFAALVLVGGLASLPGLKIDDDFTVMLPMSDPAVADQVEALKHLHQADRLYFDIHSSSNDADQLIAAAARLESVLNRVPELVDLKGRIGGGEMEDGFRKLQSELPALMGPGELAEINVLLETNAVMRRLRWVKKSMAQPQGWMLKEVAQLDPLGLSDIVLQRFRELQSGVAGGRLLDGYVTSADGRHILLSAGVRFRSSDIARSQQMLPQLMEAARSTEEASAPGQIRVAITGAHRVALDNAKMIQRDTVRTSVLATVAVLVLMLVAFRNRWYAVLCLTPTLFGILGALFVFRISDTTVAALALGCGCMLIGVTVDYGVHLLYRADAVPLADRNALASLVARLTPAVAFGALTTMAAFFIMLFSPVPGHRNLGGFSMTGVALAVVFALLVLPLVLPVGDPVAGRRQPLTHAVRWLLGWRERQKRWVLPMLLGLTLVCGFGLSQLEFDGDLASLNGVTEATRRDEESVRQIWEHALAVTTVVVSAPDLDSALEKNERLLGVLRELESQGRITSLTSVAPLMPSAKTRGRNRALWQAFWSPQRLEVAKEVLRRAGQDLGFRPDAFEPFLNSVEDLPRPDKAEDTSQTYLAGALEEFWTERDGMTSLMTQVKIGAPEDFDALHDAIVRTVPDAKLFNKGVLMNRMADVTRHSMPLFVIGVVLLNAVLLWLLLGRWGLVLVSLTPTLLGVFWTLGTLGLWDTPVNLANLIFVIFVVGVGGDYSLFFLMARLEAVRGFEEDITVTGGGVTLCALTTLLAVGVLIIAQHPALHAVGLTALLGIGFSLLATLFVVPMGTDFLLARQLDGICRPPLKGTYLRKQVELLYRYQGPYVENFVRWKLRSDPMFKVLDEVVPRTGRILDLGCGYGHVAHWLTLSESGRTVHGVDYDSDKVRVARATERMNPAVSFGPADVQSFKLPESDHALLLDVLHYLPLDGKRSLLRSISDSLPRGGTLIIRDAFGEKPNAWGRVARSERWAARLSQSKASRGLHFEPESVLFSLFQEAGFGEIQKRAVSGVNALVTAKRAGCVRNDRS